MSLEQVETRRWSWSCVFTLIGVVLASACAEPGDELESATVSAELTAPVPCADCWLPSVGARWQYQLQGPIDVEIEVVPASGGARVRPEVFVIDLYAAAVNGGPNDVLNDEAVRLIHARGAHAICYVSAGSWENWRPDAGDYPLDVLGRKNGWPGERWVDISKITILDPLLSARADKCKQAGFDGIEWDNVDGYSNRTGFKLTAADQLKFNKFLANLAHAKGLSVALKNDMAQLSELKPYFDYAINEECFRFRECNFPAPGLPDWTASGKAVFHVEYRSFSCARANAWQFSSILKDLNLFARPYTPCR